MNIENSARLQYKLIEDSDGEFLFQLDQDPAVMRYINGGKKTSRDDIYNIFIPRHNAYKNPAKGWGLWKVTMIENQQDIGWILVRPMDFFSAQPKWHDIELGWRFKQSTWGKGFATEAALQVQQALTKLPENKYFSAIAVPDNNGSIAVMKKLGMDMVKAYTHSDSQLGDLDVVLYRMENHA
ncbi:Protein N-acetyltransferase, RimJ/RimL family [Colwellia chukchiensis]|uniref:Protein N-acetyltransferase, RimJ/RimL family n=1 Tax=Colwellia chukchiensis TaxID=641665 RepID=A0A1H7N4K0_9GAMM|nr:GNAT family N-acetyltransferase [Colwellia chukchiensis]SEL17875.1 Protein N-acetyltransferase, RimJ/RimL family [Colwellia chukchiensis]